MKGHDKTHGDLIYQEIPFDQRSYLHIFIHLVFVVFGLLLLWLFLSSTKSAISIITILIAIFAMGILDLKVQYEMKLATIPIKVYKNGISMPVTSFDRIILKKSNYISLESIKSVNIKLHGPYSWIIKWPYKKVGPRYLTEIVIFTKDDKKYRTMARKTEEIDRIVGIMRNIMGNHWDEVFKE